MLARMVSLTKKELWTFSICVDLRSRHLYFVKDKGRWFENSYDRANYREHMRTICAKGKIDLFNKTFTDYIQRSQFNISETSSLSKSTLKYASHFQISSLVFVYKTHNSNWTFCIDGLMYNAFCVCLIYIIIWCFTMQCNTHTHHMIY